MDVREILRQASMPKFKSIADLMRADEAGSISDERFDDDLWLHVVRAVNQRSSYSELPQPVLNYYASRYMEWEVGNGGFGQAAHNIPELFEHAASGYAAIGVESAAALTRRAFAVLQEHGKCAAEFTDLENTLDESGWWALRERLAYVRRHRNAFLLL